MADYIVKHNNSYGNKGDIVKLDKPLTDRQKVMLEPYEKPVLASSDTKKLEAENKKLKAEIKRLSAENQSLKTKDKELEVATP